MVTICHRRGFALRRCQTCQLAFTAAWPQTAPTHRQLEGPPDVFSEYWTDEAIARERPLFSHYRKEAAEYLDLLASVGARGLLADIGCSLGVFLDEARSRSFQVMGVEPSPRAARFVNEDFGIEVRVGTIDQVGLPERSLDVVTLLDVIEHQLEPLVLLRQVERLLKPGGFALIETPRQDSLHAASYRALNGANNALRALTLGRWDHPWDGYYSFDHDHIWQGGHVVHFTQGTLDRAAERSGLHRVAAARTYSDLSYLLKRSRRVLSPRSGALAVAHGLAKLARSPNKLVAVYRVPAARV